MSQATALFLLALLTFAAGCSPADNNPRPASDLLAACEVTDVALASNTSDDRPWSLSEAAPRQGAWRTEDVVLQIPKAGEDPEGYIGWHTGFAGGGTPGRTEGPSVEMARAFALSKPVNGNACPEVRARAEAANRHFPSATPATVSVDHEPTFSKTDVMLDRAVVSPDGREAIIYLGQQFAPLAGGGYLILYRKNAQGWTEAARLPLWVS